MTALRSHTRYVVDVGNSRTMFGEIRAHADGGAVALDVSNGFCWLTRAEAGAVREALTAAIADLDATASAAPQGSSDAG